MADRGARRLAGRATWNLVDQVVSSGTNLVLTVIIARSLSVSGFGAFAVAFAVYSLLVGGSRAIIAQPLVVRYVSRGESAFYDAARAAAGGAVLLGIASGVITLAVGLVVGGATGLSLVAIGVLMPALLLQDMWRAIFVAQGRPQAAFVNDLIWAVVQFVTIGALILAGQTTGPAMILGWAGSALVAAVIGGFQFRGHPQITRSLPWLREQRDIIGYYAAGFGSVLGANQVTLFLLAAIGSPAVVGALRAAQTVLGPLNLAGYSLQAFALPEIARRHLSGRQALKVAAGISAIIVVVDLAWGLVLILLPTKVGEALLGHNWTNAQEVLPASLLGIVAIGCGLGASILMAARGFAKESFRINALLAPGFLILGVGGLLLGGALGAALGLSLAQVVVAPLVWWRIVTLMRREEASAVVPPSRPAGPA